MTRSTEHVHEGPGERCAVCRHHCGVRWFHRFPAPGEEHARYRGVVQAQWRPWSPERPEPAPVATLPALGPVRL